MADNKQAPTITLVFNGELQDERTQTLLQSLVNIFKVATSAPASASPDETPDEPLQENIADPESESESSSSESDEPAESFRDQVERILTAAWFEMFGEVPEKNEDVLNEIYDRVFGSNLTEDGIREVAESVVAAFAAAKFDDEPIEVPKPPESTLENELDAVIRELIAVEVNHRWPATRPESEKTVIIAKVVEFTKAGNPPPHLLALSVKLNVISTLMPTRA